MQFSFTKFLFDAIFLRDTLRKQKAALEAALKRPTTYAQDSTAMSFGTKKAYFASENVKVIA